VNLSGAQGGNPLSSPSRPGSVNQSKFIHLLKSEGGQEQNMHCCLKVYVIY
jgi:hypothetical protein